MAQDRFMIAPLEGGLDSHLKPWIITDDSFSRLQNAYIFRGRVRKRFGSRLMNSAVTQNVAQLFSRLRIQVDTSDGGGVSSGTVPGDIFEIGQLFSIGPDIFTVWQDGTPADMLSTNPAASGTFNTTTGEYVITDTSQTGVAVYWYPAQPVMGLITYETATSQNDPTYAFDTQFAYQYNPASSGAWDILGPIPPASGSGIWTGSNSQFFWGTTWRGDTAALRYLFITNNNPPDGIQYWNEATVSWKLLNPVTDASGSTLTTALMLVVFKNHLIALSPTILVGGTTSTTFTNQAYYAAFGDPTATNAWRSDIAGQGNSVDAATMEDIISCEFIKDRLIVFFERSTWELAFTSNEAEPFVWQKINTELGSESTWSVVPFDKIALAIGTTGIHACNGLNVERIDDKIPDNVWAIHSGNNSTERVYGIRDYYAEQVYWTFPNIDADPNSQVFPNQVLVYNYKTGSWALNDDSITAFGYYYASSQSAITWNSLDVTWDNTEITWDSGVAQALNQDILAGNQEGFVFVVDSNQTQNAPALQITNLFLDANNNVTLTVINHNFNVSDFVYWQFLGGFGANLYNPIVKIINIADANTFIVEAPDVQSLLMSFDYTGGGTLARISRIDIFTKQFNFYVKEDRNAMINRADFLVDRTDMGEITINYSMSSANPESDGVVKVGILNGAIQGTSILETSPYALYPQEALQDRVWHPVYLWADGECIQLRIYLSDTEMLDYGVATSAFQLHAYCFYTKRSSARLQ